MSKPYDDSAATPKEQVTALRDELETLKTERVAPALADVKGKAEAYNQQAKDRASEQTEVLSAAVRGSPVMALLIATGIGYMLGRVVR